MSTPIRGIMMAVVLWVLAGLVALFLLDRGLLRLESRGWINYRRRGLSRSGAAFHSLTLQAIFDPSAERLREIQYEQVEEEEETGDPFGPYEGEREDDGVT